MGHYANEGGAASMAEIFGEQGVSNAASARKIDACDCLEPIGSRAPKFAVNRTTSDCLPLSLGWQDFLNAYLVDQVFSFEIDEMRSLFVVGQICADPLRHHHDQCAVIHVHPIPSTDQFIRRVANEWTVWIDR
jgi:hypothetical protein